MGLRTDSIRAFTQPEDARQLRLIEIRHEMAALRVEKAQLTESLLMGGVCEVCGERIPEARLEAKPAARQCINCTSARR